VGIAFADGLMLFGVGCIGRIGVVVASILGLAPAGSTYFHTPFEAAVVLITLIQSG
jgi:hypothetical protein